MEWNELEKVIDTSEVRERYSWVVHSMWQSSGRFSVDGKLISEFLISCQSNFDISMNLFIVFIDRICVWVMNIMNVSISSWWWIGIVSPSSAWHLKCVCFDLNFIDSNSFGHDPVPFFFDSIPLTRWWNLKPKMFWFVFGFERGQINKWVARDHVKPSDDRK